MNRNKIVEFKFKNILKIFITSAITFSIFTQNINASVFCSEARRKEIERKRKIAALSAIPIIGIIAMSIYEDKQLEKKLKKLSIYSAYTAMAVIILSALGLVIFEDSKDNNKKDGENNNGTSNYGRVSLDTTKINRPNFTPKPLTKEQEIELQNKALPLILNNQTQNNTDKNKLTDNTNQEKENNITQDGTIEGLRTDENGNPFFDI